MTAKYIPIQQHILTNIQMYDHTITEAAKYVPLQQYKATATQAQLYRQTAKCLCQITTIIQHTQSKKSQICNCTFTQLI